MPFTPFHLGPALLFGLLLRRKIDLPTFVVTSLLVDVRTVLVFFGFLSGPLHSFVHTFAFSTVLGLGLAGVMYFVRNYTNRVMKVFKLKESSRVKSFVLAGLGGVWVHVLLDSFLYIDITPFAPIETNPLLGYFSSSTVYLFCTVAFILGLVLYSYILTFSRG